ncbi:hypothetical protein CGCS363_v003300 [Colletotrichum siamense]|uniref:uncharacterized protein n=1 Tax=Colletotrichum siamense TaxID=690259 RepID=UPI0018725607|nr:uncharacterized protein CGCS363_v003300 [Colletotrichum siamense]KAF5511451.1 hypothetical protein CGCS363_v003300 [Colletotrichum siamense]
MKTSVLMAVAVATVSVVARVPHDATATAPAAKPDFLYERDVNGTNDWAEEDEVKVQGFFDFLFPNLAAKKNPQPKGPYRQQYSPDQYSPAPPAIESGLGEPDRPRLPAVEKETVYVTRLAQAAETPAAPAIVVKETVYITKAARSAETAAPVAPLAYVTPLPSLTSRVFAIKLKASTDNCLECNSGRI